MRIITRSSLNSLNLGTEKVGTTTFETGIPTLSEGVSLGTSVDEETSVVFWGFGLFVRVFLGSSVKETSVADTKSVDEGTSVVFGVFVLVRVLVEEVSMEESKKDNKR